MPLALMGLRRFNARTPAHEYRDTPIGVTAQDQHTNNNDNDDAET
jgi:hypothetical protein